MIIFFENGHTYWENQRLFRSVNQFISPLKPGFDSKYWLPHSMFKEHFGQEYLDFRRELKMGYAPPAERIYPHFISKMGATLYQEKIEELVEMWEFNRITSARRGTLFHNKMEEEAYSGGFMTNPWDGKDYPVISYPKERDLYDNQSLADNLFDLPDGAYPELLIFHRGLRLAGQADQVFIETKRKYRYIDIGDYKTNEEKPPRSGYDRYHHPLDHLYDCKHIDYSLQISSYAWMLEQFGFKVRNLSYTWYENYEPASGLRVDVDYMKRELELVLPL